MNTRTFPFAAAMLAVPMLSGMAPAWAAQNQSPYQTPYQTMPGPTPDADALAAEMRILGNNPFDLNALISAGERTLKLGDVDAAAAFFQRAERISPNNGEIKAGKARTLVQLGRPGEALRLFAEAEGLGFDVESVGAERALAYDLIGEQERAQRAYRRALKRQPDDETQRRYALSLGISGKRDLALEQIDGLLRRSDRAAWRVRAFVLAMTGDVPGAERIATRMLPAAMAGGLQPFFQILPALSPADRAFAVHFGEVRATPERIADARMIPALPALPFEAAPPVQVAAQVAPVRGRTAQKRDRRSGRNRPVEVAALVPPPMPIPTQLPPPPRVVMVAPMPMPMPSAAMPRPTPTLPAVAAQPAPPASESPLVLASRSARTLTPAPTPPPPLPTQGVTQNQIPPEAQTRLPPAQTPSSAQVSAPAKTITPTRSSSATAVQTAVAESGTSVVVPRMPVAVPSPTPVSGPPAALANLDRPAMSSETPAGASPPPVTAAPGAAAAAAAPPVSAPPTADVSRPAPIASEESILARIIATIGVPASELGVGPTESPAVASPVVGNTAPAGPDLKKLAALDKKAAEKKAAADKLAAEKKLADKKAAEEKAAKAKEAKANPARVWVQVAGGASVRDLPKEWARLRDKAPAAFKARAAYTTPLRFTNRLLAGPFKTEDEAQSFVNQIAKSGLTGFVFASEVGQKIDKLPAK
ncbi:SPOR domain-containing protein [Sphingomonas sp. 28-63-12]|uniref:SPOR domain-containing protein n=1 Tax=Sphingomonas sp. 28-63-12 TaxID=1970434 RepID=UPI000BC43796|nr:MAG: hypothetical protein B7Y47_01745 [Sphingomonas sp. 28-63-12]